VTSSKLQRPADVDYYVEPWSDTFLQGDLFKDVPIGFAAPPDAVVMAEGERRFIAGPFDAGPAMLITPSCVMAAQGEDVAPDAYAHPIRTLVPIRPVADLLAAGAISDQNVGHLRADRLKSYVYLPPLDDLPESAALLYLPISLHHDVIARDRIAQLTGVAFWHLRVKLMAYSGGLVVDSARFGPPPDPRDRAS
jgi:hypothetical protein